MLSWWARNPLFLDGQMQHQGIIIGRGLCFGLFSFCDYRPFWVIRVIHLLVTTRAIIFRFKGWDTQGNAGGPSPVIEQWLVGLLLSTDTDFRHFLICQREGTSGPSMNRVRDPLVERRLRVASKWYPPLVWWSTPELSWDRWICCCWRSGGRRRRSSIWSSGVVRSSQGWRTHRRIKVWMKRLFWDTPIRWQGIRGAIRTVISSPPWTSASTRGCGALIRQYGQEFLLLCDLILQVTNSVVAVGCALVLEWG